MLGIRAVHHKEYEGHEARNVTTDGPSSGVDVRLHRLRRRTHAAEANEAFCDNTAEFIASLRVIEDLDSDSTIDEVEEARSAPRTAYANMLESAGGVVSAQLNELQEAYDALLAAVDDIDDERTIGEALESVDDELANVAAEASKILNDVDCGGAGSGTGQYN